MLRPLGHLAVIFVYVVTPQRKVLMCSRQSRSLGIAPILTQIKRQARRSQLPLYWVYRGESISDAFSRYCTTPFDYIRRCFYSELLGLQGTDRYNIRPDFHRDVVHVTHKSLTSS